MRLSGPYWKQSHAAKLPLLEAIDSEPSTALTWPTSPQKNEMMRCKSEMVLWMEDLSSTIRLSRGDK